jgi:hypothetical protein
MAWILGLLYTDGHIRRQNGSIPARVSFTQKSLELPEKIKHLTQSAARIYSSPRSPGCLTPYTSKDSHGAASTSYDVAASL